LTFDRPRLLARALHCYLQQDYPDDKAELLILDDAGQYRPQRSLDGKPWEIVSVSRRFSSLGAKRNAAISMVSQDTDVIAVWDDDDVYLPWTLRAHATALKEGDWSKPSLIVDDKREGIRLQEPCAQYMYHAAWAFRLEMFRAAGGYDDIVSGEDKALAGKFVEGAVKSADPIQLGFDPYFVFNRSGPSYHISYMRPAMYHRMKPQDVFIENLEPSQWSVDYLAETKRLMAEWRSQSFDKAATIGRVRTLFDA